jgi:iron complex outermembrane receptor protein
MSLSYKPLARLALAIGLALPAVATFAPATLYAQSSATLSGTVLDPSGVPLPGASVIVKDDATGTSQKMTSDGQGKYVFANLPAGKYTVQVDAPGFSTAVKMGVQIAAGQPADVPVTLALGNVSEQVTVEASEANSVAAALAPMDALLGETSARTEITKAFISNFSSPIADFGALVGMAPSTFTLNGNGVGLGQSKTYFRGFPDGDYDIDFDGIPFYDTNSPTHHSWAFFPAQFLGGIDFDRSPGTASTIGPTPFGGSIHLLSQDLSPLQNLRATFSGGSFNTYLYDVAYDAGTFGPGKKMSATVDVHHMQSHGYESLNNQTRNAGAVKFQYKISDKSVLTGFSGVIWLDANTPNFAATRCQMYGTGSNYSCILSGTTLYPYTGAGINFLLTNGSDPLLYLDTTYNYYHVPTDFEYVGLHQEFAHGFSFDVKPYTYNYDNSEKYSNATTITEATTINGLKTYEGLPIAPCDVAVVKKGVTALPCGVDKYNSYRKYGETSELNQVSKYGIFHAGFWYEWANTNRHQYPSDPLTHWTDQALPNFAEKFVTDSYQPFVEYQWNALPKLSVTPGVKFAYYTIGTQQFADDGKTIGGLGTNNPSSFIANGGSYFATLPSLSLNYRLQSGWSAFAQVAQGSIVPPSSVFDFQQGTTGAAIPPAVLPKQQKNTTYEAGTVLKLKRVTFDADYFHIHFDNSYSSTLNPAGEPVYFVQPSSITQGLEGESNLYLGQGLSIYLNASYDHAIYQGALAATCTGSTAACAAAAPLNVTTPSGMNVQQTPSDIENEGITYQKKAWNAAFFNQRVGTMYIDNGAYHNQYTVNPFSQANAFVNYTLMNGGRFNQTKIQLAFNNIFNQSNVTGITLAGTPNLVTLNANGTTYTDPFNTVGQTPINGQDNVSILAGRSIMLSVTLGLSPKR